MILSGTGWNCMRCRAAASRVAIANEGRPAPVARRAPDRAGDVIDAPAAGPSILPIKPVGGTGRIVNLRSGLLQVRLASSAADIDAAQALRYRVFYEALGARP